MGPALLHIINASPYLVHPILEFSDSTIIPNHRPNSIVLVVIKIVEHVVQSRAVGCSLIMSNNHLLSSFQHGFHPRHSTDTALCSHQPHFSHMEHNQVSLLCLFDLSK